MKTEVLLRSIGKINDELIADAESEANTKRKPGWAKLGIMVACLALVLCTGIAANAIRSNATAGSFTMDVNPSVEYTIAKSGIVKNVRCLNSDAENALSDVALGKQSVETALTRTVAAYEACGYMENGEATVLISFDSRLDANAELKASLSAEIRKALEQTDAVGTLVFHSELTENAEVAKIAEEFHVSLGRADWILTAANKTGLPTDEIARMSLDELLKFQEASGIVSVSVSKFISLEEAKKIALKDAKLDELTQKIVFTREELNRNQGKPCYLLEFYTGTNQYFYQIDAKSGSIIYAGKFITLSEAKKIALDDAGCTDKVSFTEETLVSGGIKTPYYRLVFADAKTQWTYRIDAVLGIVLEKKQKETATTEIDTADFISLEEAKKISLKDAGLDESTQKIVFTKEVLSRNSGKPCYLLEFYTGTNQYFYQIDAKSGSIIYAGKFITLSDAKKIALDDAGVSEKVTFTEETLVAGGIKSPYYYFAFESASARWTYKINAVLGVIMDKTCDKIIPPAPEFIGLEKAKQIVLEDAGLDEAAQKIVFTKEVLSRNSGKPCYILEFYTDKCAYSYKVDAVSGDITGKKTDWFSRQESETVPDTSQNSDSKQRRTD
ncbi:PepSY domain-containing protein [Hominenteromicrobium sp.]|uniref:PepSY domain-containing protein n=1 Tax=Hominenteromicrobium sp. TaxID=3073581 RepID=UPI003A955144